MASPEGNQPHGETSLNVDIPANGFSTIREVDTGGDLILEIQHERAVFDNQPRLHRQRFRVSSSMLKANSKYFNSLLEGRFGESQRIQKQWDELQEQYKSVSGAPGMELPVIHIEDIGRISSVKSIEPLCFDFLCILHGQDMNAAPPVANLANLAIVADRFDALDPVRNYIRRKRYFRVIDGKATAKVDDALSEERVRQRLLSAFFLDYGLWLEKYSLRLITKGWVVSKDSVALWWDLPGMLEEELAFRRNCVLETIQSAQSHLLSLYTSRERQCRLGYDNSAQCDSFQLGEMIRFLTRIGTLQMNGTIRDTTELLEPYAGDVYTLVDMLRQAPEYQIDRNHTHCGIRTRLIPMLELILEGVSQLGVCSQCWSQNRAEHSWRKSKRPLTWKKSTSRLRNLGHQELHTNVKALFMATQRDWSS
ncbi:Hypothetical predicted protein [Lecanosticta acicola]|uniref:BTB domain-containing protein n=1 Tax=Lecanosticta acicola TaxID=111012 RepID=A0AAI9E893_9PEZI|nr:Hypothetical predicted protein [Lecanosticta acicola]